VRLPQPLQCSPGGSPNPITVRKSPGGRRAAPSKQIDLMSGHSPSHGSPWPGGLAKKTTDGPQVRRLLALAAIYDGATRSEAAKIGGVGLQIIRDWVLRFNARGPDGLLDGKAPGRPSKLKDSQRKAIARVIESGPIPAVHGVVRWRLIDLSNSISHETCCTGQPTKSPEGP
jgi:transposase